MFSQGIAQKGVQDFPKPKVS